MASAKLLTAILFLLTPNIAKADKDVMVAAESFFDAYDTNQDGFWQQQEVQEIAKLSTSSQRLIHDLRAVLDSDGNGEVPRETFLYYFKNKHL
eukprot:m.296946 g.296946  ORF g.296946 m.296946 type:complete len:93 (-) comp74856_c0_seq1:84-362(-)